MEGRVSPYNMEMVGILEFIVFLIMGIMRMVVIVRLKLKLLD